LAEALLREGEEEHLIPLQSMAQLEIAECSSNLLPVKRQFHYDEAVRLARRISRREILIRSLTARGRWAVENGSSDRANSDLQEALIFARQGSYRIYEIEALLGLASLDGKMRKEQQAIQESTSAKNLASEIGYGWAN